MPGLVPCFRGVLPAFTRVSSQSSLATSTLAKTSCGVSPNAEQPTRSGTRPPSAGAAGPGRARGALLGGLEPLQVADDPLLNLGADHDLYSR